MIEIDPRALQERTDAAAALLVQVRRDIYPRDEHALAKEVGVSVSTILSFRSGRTVWPRPNTLFGILKAMGYRLTLTKEG